MGARASELTLHIFATCILISILEKPFAKLQILMLNVLHTFLFRNGSHPKIKPTSASTKISHVIQFKMN